MQMTASIQKIKNEILSHPSERNGFLKNDIDSLQKSDVNTAANLLLNAVEDGDERCSEPLQWLLNDQFIDFLQQRLSALDIGDQGYFFICNELFKAQGDTKYIELMKTSLMSSNKNWDMKSSALGRILKAAINNSVAYTEYCYGILSIDIERPVKKIAFINILESQGYSPLTTGLSETQAKLFDKLNSQNSLEIAAAAKQLKKNSN